MKALFVAAALAAVLCSAPAEAKKKDKRPDKQTATAPAHNPVIFEKVRGAGEGLQRLYEYIEGGAEGFQRARNIIARAQEAIDEAAGAGIDVAPFQENLEYLAQGALRRDALERVAEFDDYCAGRPGRAFSAKWARADALVALSQIESPDADLQAVSARIAAADLAACERGHAASR